MPIRMVKDDESDYNDNNDGGSGGGGGGGLGCLLALLPLAFRYPKTAAVIVVILLVFGYCGKSDENSASNRRERNTNNTEDVRGQTDEPHSRGLGADLKQSEFDKADVFAALAPSEEKNPLPDRVSLEKYAPSRKNQGMQGSCVAWSSVYAARTILQAYSSGQDPNQLIFSPSFLYNQIGLENCQGAYINEAMDLMTKMGSVPFSKFKYDENDCSREPSSALKQEAAQFRMRGYNRLTKNDNNYSIDYQGIKANLAQGAPVVIGMMVGGSFMENMFGKKIWRPTSSDRSKRGFGGHAMCVIGYDDNFEGGAFQIMNSWGNEWGENGIGWVKYTDFKEFVREAYGLDPMPRNNMDKSKFAASIGLVRNNDREYIPLNVVQGNVFTSAKINKKDKFKMEITNSIECFIYIFGLETDGSTYVLFPYTQKHSPFCGIVGTRLFPSDHSMQADDIGDQHYIGVVVTKTEIDYNALNGKINASKKTNFRERIMDALGDQDIENVQFKGGERVQFETDAKGKNAVAMIVEINTK